MNEGDGEYDSLSRFFGENGEAQAVINVYKLVDDLDEYKVRNFDGEDEAWLEFICACRNGESIYQEYDIIIGNVADVP